MSKHHGAKGPMIRGLKKEPEAYRYPEVGAPMYLSYRPKPNWLQRKAEKEGRV